jgi:S1-C subfamily serine protease
MPKSTVQRVPARFWSISCLVVACLGAGPLLRTASAQLADDVLKKVKHGTVHLHVKLANGNTAEGSGWFVDRGFVITNAHVLNMHGGDKRFPSKIEVTIDSGEKTSRTVTAKFKGAAYEADLMILQIDGDPPDLPEPLTLNPDAELSETQTVYVFGFPLGKSLGKSITVSKSSISSLRKENGELKEIQLDGGIHQGNSGGPVISDKGEVLGVAVGGVSGTTINFAVPGAYVSGLVNGKFLNFALEQAYQEGENIKIPAVVRILDPLSRIKNVRIEYWTTPNTAGKPRRESWTRPEPVEGDGPLQTVDAVQVAKSSPRAELLVPPLPDENSAYWFRATLTDGRGKEFWSPTIANFRPVPLERREVTLQFKSTAGAKKPVEITNDSAFKFQVGTRKETLSMMVRAQAIPNLFAPDQDGDTRGNLRYHQVSLGMRKNGEAVQVKEKWTPLAQNLLKTTATFRYAEDGAMVYSQPDLRKTEAKFKGELVGISDLILQSLELTSLPLPHHPMQPKDRIRLQKMLLVGLPEMYVPTHADVKYQYLGVRKVDGRETAFFALNGDLRPRRGDDTQINGSVSGSLDVLLETGEVLMGNAFMNVDFDVPGSKGLRMIGTLAVNVRPAPPPPASANKPADNVAKTNEKPAEKPEEKPEGAAADPAGGDAQPDQKDPQPAQEPAKAPAKTPAKVPAKVKASKLKKAP